MGLLPIISGLKAVTSGTDGEWGCWCDHNTLSLVFVAVWDKFPLTAPDMKVLAHQLHNSMSTYRIYVGDCYASIISIFEEA